MRKAILRRCPQYDVSKMKGIIREGIEELGETPKGRILIKPNVVTANKGFIHHSYTDPRLVESMVEVLRESIPNASITIGECGGIGVPTRMSFKDAGYSQMGKRLKVPVVDFDEQQTAHLVLSKAKLHRTMQVAKSLYEADTKIWMPKLKFHTSCQFTNALKLNIGLLIHKERLLYHDDRLHHKIVDMLEIGWPDLVVTDAVVVGRGFESSPYPVELGALLISNDPVAADTIAAHVMNYSPTEVPYLVEACHRGYGSIDVADIQLSGDVTVEELADRIKGIESPFQDLEKIDTPICFYQGVNRDSGNVCYGGCICSMKGVLGMAERKYPENLARARKGAIVMGHYVGDVVHPGETVVLIGDCAGVEGKLEARKVVRFKGCPSQMRDLLIFMLRHFKIKSPAWNMANLTRLIYHSMAKTLMKIAIPLRRRSKIGYYEAHVAGSSCHKDGK